MHRSDCPELFGMARTKESAQRYQIILSATILLAEVVGWERDYHYCKYIAMRSTQLNRQWQLYKMQHT